MSAVIANENRQLPVTMGLRDIRVVLIVLLLMAAAAAEGAVVAFRIPRGAPAFGVKKGVTEEQCRYILNDPRFAAPFRLGTAAAIHLGNTKSCIAGYGDGDQGSVYRFCIPSWVAFTDEGALSGEAARNHAALNPETAFSGFTRLLHRSVEDDVVKKEMELVPHYNFTWDLGSAAFQLKTGQVLSPQHLAGILISELKHMAEAHLGREITNAVITVPRHVTYQGRHSVTFAGRGIAGFRAAKVVDEQIAAAAAHGHHTQQGDGKVVLVFHVGGRTAHATLFKFINGMAWFIQARDDPIFGGDDFTARVVDYFVELVKQQNGIDIRHDKMAMLRLRAECERAKKALSEYEETIVQVDSLVDGVDLSAPLTRAKFEELNHDLLDRAMALLDWVVMAAPVVEKKHKTLLDRAMEMVSWVGSRPEERRKDLINEIVLVGGSARIPKLHQLVKDYFHGREPNGGVEPDETVIHGAMQITLPEAAGYLEECYHPWHWGPPILIRPPLSDSQK